MTFKPALAQRPHMRDRGVEHVGVLVLPLGGEIAPRPAAAIDDVAGVRAAASNGVSRASG